MIFLLIIIIVNDIIEQMPQILATLEVNNLNNDNIENTIRSLIFDDKFKEAVEFYDTLPYNEEDYLNRTICQILDKGNVEVCEQFKNTESYLFCMNIEKAYGEKDISQFTHFVNEYDKQKELLPLQVTILLMMKNKMKNFS